MGSQGHTSIDTISLTHTWEIKDFDINNIEHNAKFISEFSVDLYNMKWSLAMCPKGAMDSESKEYHSSVLICLKESERFPLFSTITFSILNAEGENCNEYTLNWKFSKPNEVVDDGLLLSYIESKKLIETNLINQNKLILVCQISLIEPCLLKEDKLLKFQWCTDKLVQDLHSIMKNESLSDICITLSGQRFNVHKVILSARSPVFAALFNHDMKENNENTVHIQDDDVDAFKEMLHFIYTGKVENLSHIAYELFTLSDKYQLNDLKKVCEIFLSENITLVNVIDILLLSDRHEAKELKMKAIHFIVVNLKLVANTADFMSLEKTHPFLLGEMRSIAEKPIQ